MNGERSSVSTSGAPRPVFSYSQGISSNGLLFVSGQVPIDPTDGSIPEGFAAQVRRTLENVAAIASSAGASLADAVRVGVYLADESDFEEMDTIYREHFAEPLPARTTITVGLRGFRIEIDAVIALPAS